MNSHSSQSRTRLAPLPKSAAATARCAGSAPRPRRAARRSGTSRPPGPGLEEVAVDEADVHRRCRRTTRRRPCRARSALSGPGASSDRGASPGGTSGTSPRRSSTARARHAARSPETSSASASWKRRPGRVICGADGERRERHGAEELERQARDAHLGRERLDPRGRAAPRARRRAARPGPRGRARGRSGRTRRRRARRSRAGLPRASSAMTLRELAALPGDRRLALLLDDEPRAGDRLARTPRRRQRVAGVGLVAVGDDDGRRVDRREVVERRRTAASAGRRAARRRPPRGARAGASRWRMTLKTVSRHWLGHAAGRRRPRRSPRRRRCAARPTARPSARGAASSSVAPGRRPA